MNTMKTNPPSPSKCRGRAAAPCRQGAQPPAVRPTGRPLWRNATGSLTGVTGVTGVGIAPTVADSGGQLSLPLAQSLPPPVPRHPAKEAAASMETQEGSGNTATDLHVQFQDREKELLDQIRALTMQVNLLGQENKDKDSMVTSLTEQMDAKELELEERLATERQTHRQSREELAKVENLAKERMLLLQENTRLHHEEVEKMQMQVCIRAALWQHKESMAAVLEGKEKEVQCLEEKIGKLKQHIADLLNGRSRERQQQLDELRKELTRITQENELMQKKLKRYTSGKEVLNVVRAKPT
ncbi:centrosome-associated protein CEP250-like isoform X1 [Lethenteron reissneri]|uniref:centrosome-associated protein CEP250-like isoform X1 n=1 Tax=Lethenteron reissneri TaxID=7753 RepID=UPI002AB6FCB9|nr:centrosome-associated protein CEP250-like isoform X1 [Lethenteron reissneri]XP_061414736.1 centrosome-associated protein CEP250-like isoform X1 [Lethenteron reissneri]